MEYSLSASRQMTRQSMRVGIAGKQHGLKEKHAGRPNPRAAAKPRQQVFGYDRLNLEEKKRSQENREGEGSQRINGSWESYAPDRMAD